MQKDSCSQGGSSIPSELKNGRWCGDNIKVFEKNAKNKQSSETTWYEKKRLALLTSVKFIFGSDSFLLQQACLIFKVSLLCLATQLPIFF